MFKKILIANRGEIALRIIRACHELGLKSVAVYSTADKYSLHVKFADEAVCIGPPQSSESYLNIPRIIAAGEITNSDAIHPGYGFLAENAEFSKICKDNGFAFIGPNSDIINSMGDKAQAKKTMSEAGVPVIPGNEGILKNSAEAIDLAKEMGYPVMLKASAGGGGRGMRLVNEEKDLEKLYTTASNEALTAFNNGDMYIEKFLENPRHIEIQILADFHGNVVSLGERECSIQRRHQKLIEEAPSPAVDDNLRKKMGEAAVKGAKAVNYIGVGTIEFLLDKNKIFYFMEMNTRIQVEHPITEMVTGADLIKQQIRMHAGEKFPEYLYDFKLRGHSIECRINAENPALNFQPSPGIISVCHQPSGFRTRVDGAIFQGCKITPFYDSLIAKVICKGRNRTEAIQRTLRSLDEFVLEGITTTIDLHKKILNHKKFINSDFDTNWLGKEKFY